LTDSSGVAVLPAVPHGRIGQPHHDDQGQHDRVFDGRRAIFTLEEVHELTHIDPWFLAQILEIVNLELEVEKRTLGDLDGETLRFLKGGLWRYFMVKYPEVNTLHKRMLWASDLVHRVKKTRVRNAALLDRERKRRGVG
jgi:hypothetical protein